jgi:hypothetical protein
MNKGIDIMRWFSEGDLVRCIDAEDSDGRLVEGKVYRIMSFSGDMLDLGHDFLWEDVRFELA